MKANQLEKLGFSNIYDSQYKTHLCSQFSLWETKENQFTLYCGLKPIVKIKNITHLKKLWYLLTDENLKHEK